MVKVGGREGFRGVGNPASSSTPLALSCREGVA